MGLPLTCIKSGFQRGHDTRTNGTRSADSGIQRMRTPSFAIAAVAFAPQALCLGSGVKTDIQAVNVQ